MIVEQQYIDLFSQTEAMICKHSAEVLNAPRAAAFADFERLGFPTRKMEKYKYTDVSKYFEPDYGLNLNRLAIPVNPYEVFKCDVPNMSTALYFVVNDAFYNRALPKVNLPEGVIFGSLKEVAGQHPELVKKYYGQLADTSKDGVTAFNTAFDYHHNSDKYHTPLHYGQNIHQCSYKVQQPYPDKTLSVYVLFSTLSPDKQLKSRHHNIMKMYID